MAETRSNLLAGKYRVEASLGRGGMAEVYKVWDPDRRASVAMKVLHEFLADDPVFLTRFQREARTLSKLEHPNIVRFYEFSRVGDLAFMLMEYVEGTTLSRVRSRIAKPFTPGQMLWILKPVCAALHFAHGKGLVHCDIKSGNIMLDSTGKILLADFGIARSTDAATVTTMAGAGTPAYMSPEQIIGADPAPQMDIYALGVVLFELATGGRLPFTGEKTTAKGTNAEKIRWEKRNLPPPSPREFNPDVSLAMEAVILRCLAIDPGKRYKTVTALLEALAAAAGVPEERLPADLLVPGEKASDALTSVQARGLFGLGIPGWVYAAIGVVALGGVALAAVAGYSLLKPSSTPAESDASNALAALASSATPPATATSFDAAATVNSSIAATIAAQPTAPPAVAPVTWDLKPSSKGYYLTVRGGPDHLDRLYGPLRAGAFVPATNGKFGMYVDNNGYYYVVNFSKTVLQQPWGFITKQQFKVFLVDDTPDYDLQLFADDNETYRLVVHELKFDQTITLPILRPMEK
jgi:serine/threonine protein kinase